MSFLDDLEKEERKARNQLKLDAEEKKAKKKGKVDVGSGSRRGEQENSSSSEEEEEEDTEDDEGGASGSDSEDGDALRDYERAPRSLLDDRKSGAAEGEGDEGRVQGNGGGSSPKRQQGQQHQQQQQQRRSLLPVKTPTGTVLFGDDAVSAAHASAEARARKVEGITLIEEEIVEREKEIVEEKEEEEVEEPAASADAADAADSDGNASDSSGSSGWGSPVVSDDDGGEGEDDGEEGSSSSEDEGEHRRRMPPAPSGAPSPLLSAESLEAARVRIAALATRVLECPEKRLADLRSLVAEASGAATAAAGLGPAATQDPRVTRLAILSAAAVFRDIAPGYRVRPFDEAAESAGASFDGAGGGAAVRLSAEVRALRAFEGGLLSSYGNFLKALLRASDAGRSASSSLLRAAAAGMKGGDGDEAAAAASAASAASAAAAALSPAAAARRASGRAATRAMGSLLSSLPHFNYSSDLLRALVPRLDDPDRQCASAAREAISSVFEAGGALAAASAAGPRRGKSRGRKRPAAQALSSAVRGGLAAARLRRDGAQLIAELIKKKRCRCSASVLAPLASLDLTVPTLRRHGSSAEDGESSKRANKRQLGRKAAAKAAKAARHARAADPVAAARAAADPEPDAAELALLASEAAEAVFEAYFRVVKHAAAADVLAVSGKSGANGSADNAAAATAAAPIPASLLARRCPLLLPALRGLSRAAPGLGTEYAADLHAALASLLATPRAPPCLCAAALRVSAGSLVGGIGDALLSVDRGGVHAALFAAIGRVSRHCCFGLVLGSGEGGERGRANKRKGLEAGQNSLFPPSLALDFNFIFQTQKTNVGASRRGDRRLGRRGERFRRRRRRTRHPRPRLFFFCRPFVRGRGLRRRPRRGRRGPASRRGTRPGRRYGARVRQEGRGGSAAGRCRRRAAKAEKLFFFSVPERRRRGGGRASHGDGFRLARRCRQDAPQVPRAEGRGPEGSKLRRERLFCRRRQRRRRKCARATTTATEEEEAGQLGSRVRLRRGRRWRRLRADHGRGPSGFHGRRTPARKRFRFCSSGGRPRRRRGRRAARAPLGALRRRGRPLGLPRRPFRGGRPGCAAGQRRSGPSLSVALRRRGRRRCGRCGEPAAERAGASLAAAAAPRGGRRSGLCFDEGVVCLREGCLHA